MGMSRCMGAGVRQPERHLLRLAHGACIHGRRGHPPGAPLWGDNHSPAAGRAASRGRTRRRRTVPGRTGLLVLTRPATSASCARTPVRYGAIPLHWGRAPGSAHRARRARTQPQGRRRRVPARPARRHHRAQRLGQEQPRLRHHLRRGPAALRREPERLRPAVPRADGEARRRPDRRALPGDLDRPEGRVAQPALHGRHGHRDLRPPAAAVRPDRHPALPQRPCHRAPDRPADRRPGPRPARGHPAARPRAAHQGPQDRGRPDHRGRPAAGLRPRPRRRGDARHRGRPQARQVQAALHRGRRRPLRRPPCRGARGRRPRRGRPAARPGDRAAGPRPGRRPPRRLDRDGPAARRGRGPDRSVAARRRGARLRGAALQREVQLPVRRVHRRGARAADLLVQLAARRVPGLRRPRDPPRDRPGPRDPRPLEEPGHRGARAVGAHADRRVVAAQDPRGHLRVARLGLHRPDRRPAGRGGRVRAPRRQEREGRRPLPPRARREHLQRDLRGRDHEPRAPLPRDRLGLRQDRAREVHGQPAVPDLRRQAAPPGDPGGHHRRPERLGRLDHVDHGGPPLGDRAGGVADRARADDRLPGRQGDQRTARASWSTSGWTT